MQPVADDNACVPMHPASAVKAWAQVLALEPEKVRTGAYLTEWKSENAFQGLNKARLPKGSVTRDTTVHHPSNVRTQYTVNRLLEHFPTESAATGAACVAGYDPNLSKEDQKLLNTKCGTFGNCYTVNEKGEFQNARDVAKEKYKIDHKGKVTRGFCMPSSKANFANLDNKRHATEELQLLMDRIAFLEERVRQLEGKPIVGCETREKKNKTGFFLGPKFVANKMEFTLSDMTDECQQGFDFVLWNTDKRFTSILCNQNLETNIETFIATLLEQKENQEFSTEFRKGIVLYVQYIDWLKQVEERRIRLSQRILPIQRELNLHRPLAQEAKECPYHYAMMTEKEDVNCNPKKLYCEHERAPMEYGTCYHSFSFPRQDAEVANHEDAHYRFNKLTSVLHQENDHSESLTRTQYKHAQKQQITIVQKLKKNYQTLKHAQALETKQRIWKEIELCTHKKYNFNSKTFLQKKGTNEAQVSRGWFYSKDQWIAIPSNVPQDVIAFGRMVNKDGTGFWRTVFSKKSDYDHVTTLYNKYIVDKTTKPLIGSSKQEQDLSCVNNFIETMTVQREQQYVPISRIPNEINQRCDECGEPFTVIAQRQNKATGVTEDVFVDVIPKQNTINLFVHAQCVNIIRVACKYECHLCHHCGEKINVVNISKQNTETDYDDDFALECATRLKVIDKFLLFHKKCACFFLTQTMKKTLHNINGLNSQKKRKKQLEDKANKKKNL